MASGMIKSPGEGHMTCAALHMNRNTETINEKAAFWHEDMYSIILLECIYMIEYNMYASFQIIIIIYLSKSNNYKGKGVLHQGCSVFFPGQWSFPIGH